MAQPPTLWRHASPATAPLLRRLWEVSWLQRAFRVQGWLRLRSAPGQDPAGSGGLCSCQVCAGPGAHLPATLLLTDRKSNAERVSGDPKLNPISKALLSSSLEPCGPALAPSSSACCPQPGCGTEPGYPPGSRSRAEQARQSCLLL